MLRLLQDYPSLAELHEKLQQSNILPIFAVTNEFTNLYTVMITFIKFPKNWFKYCFRNCNLPLNSTLTFTSPKKRILTKYIYCP